MSNIPNTLGDLQAYAGQKRNHPLLIPSNLDVLDGTRFECRPMNSDWKNRIKDEWWHSGTIPNQPLSEEHREHLYKLLDLRKTLLSIGGESTCLPIRESDIDNILSYGQFWYGDKAILRKGTPCHCHDNSGYLWSVNRESMRICTGYALSADGMWRQHSWIMWFRPRVNTIIETTVKRIAYFGFVMTDELCEQFYI